MLSEAGGTKNIDVLIFRTSFSLRSNELYFLWLKTDIFFPKCIPGKGSILAKWFTFAKE